MNFLQAYEKLENGVPTEVAKRLGLTLTAITTRCLRGHLETWRTVNEILAERETETTELRTEIESFLQSQQTTQSE